jgi:beta-mannanase
MFYNAVWYHVLHLHYSWGILKQDQAGNFVQTLEGYKAAWKHIVQLFRDRNSPVKFQNDLNSRNGLDKTTDLKEFFPDAEYVDGASITCYNRYAIACMRRTLVLR